MSRAVHLDLTAGLNLLVAYDPLWPAAFEEEKARLTTALGPLAKEIAHYGSTSVPGLCAKPILDIMVGVSPLSDWEKCKTALEAIGYDYAANAGVPDHYIFGRGRDRTERTHLVHVVEYEGESWRRSLAFRDALRHDAGLRESYAQAKTRAAAAAPENRAGYNAQKGPFIEKCMEDRRNRVTGMPAIGLDYRTPPHDPATLYAALYSGEILRYSGLPEMAALIAGTRTFVEERLPSSPVEIHRHIAHEELAPLLAATQRDYARSSEMKKLWHAMFEAAGLDPADTARDRLMLRFQVHSDAGTSLPWARSTATVGFHRDTWGTNLAAQVNWWAPVWPVTEGRTFAIHRALWDVPIENNSADFDLADVIQRLRTAPATLGPGQLAPRPLKPMETEGGVPVVIEPGEIIAFSSAHAHVGVPNHTGLTRVSLETRTVSIADVRAGRGAPNVDGRGRWAAPGLFRRLSDGRALHELLGCERLVRYPGGTGKTIPPFS